MAEIASGAIRSFRALYGRPAALAAEAPGRANLIGEHTDYNGGFVLPVAIPQRTRVEIAPRDDRTVRVGSAAMAPRGRVLEYELGKEAPGRGWLDYIQGLTVVLARDGQVLRGFEARVASRVPVGSGLASSAALEVALLRALRAVFDLPLDDVALARMGQRAENEFVGARVGVMDQMAASLGEERAALLLDTRSLSWEKIALPSAAELVVLHSGVSHAHAAGEYNVRREECERACRLLGVPQLRDVGPQDVAGLASLPEPLGRRARHVVTENERVRAAAAALRTGDLAAVGAFFYASHASMRDDYEVSIPEIDLLVELARAEAGVYGARLTGGGFGGSVVVLAEADRATSVAERVARAYAARSGRSPQVLVPPPEGTGAPTAAPRRRHRATDAPGGGRP